MDSEYLKKLKDPKFYLEKFCKIKGKTPGLIPFKLNEAQKDLFNTIKWNNRVIILKSRQIGFSTAVVGYLYHKTIMTPGTNTAIIGYNTPLTAELLDKVKTFWKSTPEALRPTIQYNSKSEISFPSIDSKIIVLPSTENVGRGYTLHNVLLTELSAWEKAEDKMMSLEASVPIDGKIVIESCVTGDTIVFTKNGPCFMEDIHDWDKNPLGFSEGKEIELDGHYGLRPTTTYYNSGIKKGFRVVTKHGYEVGMSSVHKLFVLRGDALEFVESKDLKPGDFLAMKYCQELWGGDDSVNWEPVRYGAFNKKNIKPFAPDCITEDLAYLIGVILGDGYISRKSGNVVVTNIDKDLTDFLLSKPFGLNFRQGKGINDCHFICSNLYFVQFLQDYIGFKEGVKAPKKEVPKLVLGWSRKNVIAFLQGLFDADGSCRKDRGEVSLTSTSKKIIDVTRMLLLNFGIISNTYSYIAKPSKKVKVWSSGYRLEISRAHSSIFLNKIGFRIKRKQTNRKTQSESYTCLQELIPGLGKILKMNMKKLGLKYSDVSNGMNKCFFSESGNVTYRTLERILEKCQNKESDEYIKIKELFDKKYFYNEIKEIISIEENVYDFTIDDGHTFVSNGFVGHNTPRGQGNLYHKMFMTPDNGYVKKEYGWWWGYSQEEIDEIRRRMNNPMRFAQEYGLEFLASGRSVFDANCVNKQRENILKVGDNNNGFVVTEDRGFRQYAHVNSECSYIFGVDTSEGVEGGDYSTVTVWNRMNGEEVGFYRGLIEPDRFGKLLNEFGRKFNNALMVVEINNHGLTTLTILKQLMYPTLYFRLSQYETIGTRYTDRLGWKTTKLTRPLLIDDLSQALREGTLTIHSKETIDELSTFIYDKHNNMVPAGDAHDDCIFAAAIGLQGYKTMWDRPLDQLDYTLHLNSEF